MTRFLHAADTAAAQSLAGFVAAHDDLVAFGVEGKFVRRRVLTPGKVAVISGGGAGHEPLHCGFIGAGMLDAACTGHVFTSPTPDQILAAMDETDTGAGCLLVVKNYDGDVMNFEMAAEMAAGRHRIETVIVEDDAAYGPSVRSRGRRGVAGTVVVEKLLGAAAERGDDLAGLKALGEGLSGRVRSMGVALRGVSLPDTGRETFALGPDEMEIGVGIHGEPGLYRTGRAGPEEIVRLLCEPVLAQLSPLAGACPLLIVNGFGGTPPIELHLAHNLIRTFLRPHGIVPARALVGTFVTSLDMAGLSVTLALLTPAEFALWCAPVATPTLVW